MRERDWYDSEYVAPPEPQDDLNALWESSYYPMNKEVREAVGDVTGQDVLLVGNGTSQKELVFADTARRVVFTDYSERAVRTMAESFPRPTVEYLAADATDLPFPDESFDVVYAYAVVHHLPGPEVFLREAARVLRPGGRAVFMDNPRSDLYQRAKIGVLEPLMRYYHRRGGISPEDQRATETGWLSVDELAALMPPGVRPFFHRSLLVHYLVTRAAERLPPQPLWRRYYHRNRRAQLALIRLDDWLSRFRVVRENQMRLVWGFVKQPISEPGPSPSSAQPNT